MRWTSSTSLSCMALVSVAISSGCRKESAPSASDVREVDPALVRVDSEHMNLRHDQVGHGAWASQASFVLVDAHNTHAEDLMVTLGGELIDRQGQSVGQLRPTSLRIPAGGVRTFALIDVEQAVRAQAASARIRVAGAHVPGYPPPVQVTDGHVYKDGDRVVVSARVHNTAENPVRALVLGGFYDQRGVPMRRPFTEMYLPGHGSHPAQFVGPPGSVKGYIFIGDLVY